MSLRKAIVGALKRQDKQEVAYYTITVVHAAVVGDTWLEPAADALLPEEVRTHLVEWLTKPPTTVA